MKTSSTALSFDVKLISDPLISAEYVKLGSQMLGTSVAAVLNALKNQVNANYASELRRREVELRREMAAEARREQMETAGAKGADPIQQESPAPIPAANSEEFPPEDFERDPYADRPLEPMGTPVSPSPIANNTALVTRPTDQFERNIIKNIVRYGGLPFNYNWEDENGQMQSTQMRVIDFYNATLQNDGLVFQHPLYARMLQMAIEKAADPVNPFYSDRFFIQHPDAEINRLALDLLEDRFHALGTVEYNVQLDTLIPRAMAEYQNALLLEEIDTLNRQLRTPGSDYRAIMEQINQLNEIKRYLAKQLGERTIR